MDIKTIEAKAIELAETLPLKFTECAVTRDLYGYSHPIVSLDSMMKDIASMLPVPIWKLSYQTDQDICAILRMRESNFHANNR